MTVYYVGDQIRITGTFKTSAAVLTDPTTVALQTKTASGTTASYTYALGEITKSSTGVYYKDVTLSESGLFTWEWEAGGVLVKIDGGSIWVQSQRVST